MGFAGIKHFNFKAFLLLAFIILLAYSSSFNGAWVLDDDQNILINNALHIEEISFSTLKGTLFASPYEPGSLYRPLPCLNFALNWYWGQDNPFGYHVVNYVRPFFSFLQSSCYGARALNFRFV